MKSLISNRYANVYLNAADTLGLNYSVLNEKAAFAEIYNQNYRLTLSANVLGINSQLSSTLASNKMKTSVILESIGLPVPQFKTFTNKDTATEYALQKLKKKMPIVLKPISGSLSIGITVNPTTQDQVHDAITEAFTGNSEILIEEYIRGNHYRITILDDEIMAVTHRLPAYVVGDGVKTIAILIAEKNIIRGDQDLPLIVLRDKDLNYLKSKNLDLNSICKKGDKIMLQLGCDLDIGGERVRINRDSVPEINKQLFIAASKALNLRFSGIDYISPDITIPYTKTVSAINEINSAPDSDVHYRDSFPYENYAAERVLKKIFRNI